jgi:hypothetical protein
MFSGAVEGDTMQGVVGEMSTITAGEYGQAAGALVATGIRSRDFLGAAPEIRLAPCDRLSR